MSELEKFLSTKSPEQLQQREHYKKLIQGGLINVLSWNDDVNTAKSFFDWLEYRNQLLELQKIVISQYPNLLPLINNLNTETAGGEHPFFRLYKLKLALAVRKYKGKLNNGICLYGGSGMDIEFPILMGWKSIVLVDPLLAGASAQEFVLSKLLKYGKVNTVKDIDGTDLIILNQKKSSRIMIKLIGKNIDEYDYNYPISHLLCFLRVGFDTMFKLENIKKYVQSKTIITDDRIYSILLPSGIMSNLYNTFNSIFNKFSVEDLMGSFVNTDFDLPYLGPITNIKIGFDKSLENQLNNIGLKSIASIPNTWRLR